MSSCPPSIAHMLDGGQFAPDDESHEVMRFESLMDRLSEDMPLPKAIQPKAEATRETRSQRVARVREQHPGCAFHFCQVDTENVFTFENTQYVIHPSLQAYQPKETKHGLLYDMDQITVVRDTEGTLHFYDQQFEAIESTLVMMM